VRGQEIPTGKITHEKNITLSCKSQKIING
jgi:hypothetical protein